MKKLLRGIVEFREELLPQYAARFRGLARGQEPDALFITCSDSRVVPDLLVSTDPGDLFVLRNVGNLIPPASADGVSTGDVSEASAIEFSVLVLEVPHIVVCGHSGCGAMKAVMERRLGPEVPNLAQWLHYAATAAFRLDHEGPLDESRDPCDQLSQLNVLVQMEHLMTYPIVRSRVESGALLLAGWWFDIATGDMHAYDRSSRSFQVIDREHAARLTARLLEKGGPAAG